MPREKLSHVCSTWVSWTECYTRWRGLEIHLLGPISRQQGGVEQQSDGEYGEGVGEVGGCVPLS